MKLHGAQGSGFAILLVVTRLAAMQAPAPAAQRPSVILVTNAVGLDGTRYFFEISHERTVSLPQWDQRAAPDPPLSMIAARKAAEAWLVTQAPEIKTFEMTNLSLLRMNPTTVLTAPCRLTGCWYYRMSFDPVAGGRTLFSGGGFTVVVLLDGTIVEPRIGVSAPGTGPGIGGPGGPGSGTGGGRGPQGR
jgi:hypothetical protein